MTPANGSSPRSVLRTLAFGALTLIIAFSAMPPTAGPVAGRSSLRSRIAEARRTQTRLESVMRERDRRIGDIQRDRAAARRHLRRTRDRLVDLRQSRRETRGDLDRVRDRLERKRDARVRVRVAGDRRALTRSVRRLDTKVDRLQRVRDRLESKERRAERRRDAQRRRIERAADRVGMAYGRRSNVEYRLAQQIRAMTALAKQRAAKQAKARPGRNGSRIARPLKAHVSQRYGCTGFRWAPRRGGCRHFHDGIDFAAPRGTRVRAAATGVVAYVGWSPHDTGDRAFVVIIGHAGGLETLYAHLRPIRRVRVGQLVRRGDVIGLVGNTGRSTGPHLHWEVSRRFKTMDPRKVT